jgi:hypothetical protein
MGTLWTLPHPNRVGLQIIQKFGSRLNARDQHVIPRARASDMKQMSSGVVNLIEIGVIIYGLYSRLQGNGSVKFSKFMARCTPFNTQDSARGCTS